MSFIIGLFGGWKGVFRGFPGRIVGGGVGGIYWDGEIWQI